MRTVVHGSTGHMGRCVIESLEKTDGAEYIGGISPEVVPSENAFLRPSDCTLSPDVVIDFSFHGAVPALMEWCVEKKCGVVVATTGLTDEEMESVRKASSVIPVFHSANMSYGVAVLSDLARRTASLFPGAEIEIVETHHDRKLDAPSGTALMIADEICSATPERYAKTGRSGHGKRERNEIGIHALRYGNVVGIHDVIISTGNETITLRHEAFSRSLFADGAVKAAQWLCGREPGLYNMKDMLKD